MVIHKTYINSKNYQFANKLPIRVTGLYGKQININCVLWSTSRRLPEMDDVRRMRVNEQQINKSLRDYVVKDREQKIYAVWKLFM